MALVSDCPPDLRIYEPSFGREYPSPREQSEHRSRLLHKLHVSYHKALERLSPRARPGMAARFLHGGGGCCLGLLDPVSNIVANALVSYGRWLAAGEPGGAFDDDDGELVYVPDEKLRDLERRSMEGMVAFLTRFFPYLADCEATQFLLVAVRIAAADLGMRRFGGFSSAVNRAALPMALKCAAVAAQHPDPDRLVRDWLAISSPSRLGETTRLLDEVRRRSPLSSVLDRLAELLDVSPPAPVHEASIQEGLSCLWRLTASRAPPRRYLPYQHTPAIKSTLQDAIHGFYLAALARLPAGELRSRFHRSLLESGHCYGPLDPVSNIIINTVWYDAAFPPTVELELDTVGTMSLHRTENRSLYGLASFICTHDHNVGFDQAVERLLETDGRLLLNDGGTSGVLVAGGLDKAFLAAATAACHPSPDAQAKILLRCSCDPKLGDVLSSLLQGDRQLSSADVQCLARLLCPESDQAACSEQQPLRPFPYPSFLGAYTRMSKKVSAALRTYAAMPNGEPMYELHTICGVNHGVLGPVGTSAKCYRSHVNFLATPKVDRCSTSAATPQLFFAEVINHDDDRFGTQPFCCRVSVPLPCAERVRCLYCDYMGIRIVHPIEEEFHGRKLEFEKMACGEDPCNDDFDPALMQLFYTNMKIISHSSITTNRVCGAVEEDRLYDDYYPVGSDEHDSDLTLMGDDHDNDLCSMSANYHTPPYNPLIVSCSRCH